MHLCVAGWMEGGKVGYPTRYPSMRCGENHVGVVLYKDPVDQSSTYDAYCYRLSGAAHLQIITGGSIWKVEVHLGNVNCK